MSQQRDIELERWNELQELRREVQSKFCSYAWTHPPEVDPASATCYWDDKAKRWVLPK